MRKRSASLGKGARTARPHGSADIPVGFTDAEFLISFIYQFHLAFRTDQSGRGRLPVQGQTGPRSRRITLLLRLFSCHWRVWRATQLSPEQQESSGKGKNRD